MMTIKDIAGLAGVTPMTVSNVLRNRGRVGELTRQRVMEVVEAHGYRPNLTARALVERRAPTLALMLGCITNPFYPEFTLQANNAARRHGRFLLVCNTDYEPDSGTRFMADVAGSLSDGILVANTGELRVEELKAIQASGTPVVVSVWEFPDEPPEGIPCVAFDSRKAGRIATEHLLELGHTRIGALVASAKKGIHGGRYQGYCDAMRAAKVKHVLADAHFGEDSYQGGYDAAIALLTTRPDLTALFVSNDLPALGVLNAAASLGRSVPGDLSVVSITNIELTGQSRPALTTVSIPTAEMAEASVDLLIRLIGQPGAHVPMVMTSDPVLIRRASTAPLQASPAPSRSR
ncbi:LacI family DNA-binding transcriptional regulator [Pararobbsia silviterrae]|uniref:LacI family transcriptional regulator n=1 Tax=Pararobbsia silviterrae TaxID=1792498 RepID=A0A494X638_9BURK|nr:LacI family DNA-binding transcriptional regulator [Pararobbsia silviterrae]RKP46138.1 LacI family transcriptional regulator [Pararobbsia silviterrae]